MIKLRIKKQTIKEILNKIDTRLETASRGLACGETVLDIDDSNRKGDYYLIVLSVALTGAGVFKRKYFWVDKLEYAIYETLALVPRNEAILETY